ncbi:hypothetical protein Si091_01866 [Streptococcus infantarius subsp. infantarius]|nr:hypothetical protein [Streptococcus infantarius subsp. infantarius]MCO4564718.1 hypothetical protein [Streptococcus infantarius subsp. infantarius]MCO4621835.1 hypothetical protein [Streptococcus infantarius subsp. infantarius]
MKRLLSLITLVFTTIVLVACSSKPNMDGEYYEIGDYGTDLVITIKGDKGTVDAEGSTSSMTIETDTQTFEISGFVNPTVKYEYKDDVITANITGSERQYFKKGSEAYKEELKKFNGNGRRIEKGSEKVL